MVASVVRRFLTLTPSRRLLVRLGAGGVAGLCVVVGLIALAFQDNLFKWWHAPNVPFIAIDPPPAPNYALEDSWALRSVLARDGGTSEPLNPSAIPAIFFVHPTSFWGRTGWNGAIDDGDANRRLDAHSLATYAGPFAPHGDVWVPRYRQAALFASLTVRFDARQARSLAAADVSRAFKHFIAQIPPDQPIIIAGVEQGGLHALYILSDVATDPTLRDRFVAAYIIDQALPLAMLGEDGSLAGLSVCVSPDEVGCLIAYGAVSDEDTQEIVRFRDRSMAWSPGGRLVETAGRSLACVNPVLGASGEDLAVTRANRGAVNGLGFTLGETPPPQPGQTSAQCLDGVLLVERAKSPSLREPWRWGGRFKQPLTNLFYADIDADVERRIAAFE